MKLSKTVLEAISQFAEPVLDLSSKSLVDDDLEMLCNSLRQNQTIKYLILDHNQISSKGVKLLINLLPKIEGLSLAYNDINDSCLLDLAVSRFKSFNLSWNYITDKGVDILIQHSLQERISVDSTFVSEEKKEQLELKLKRKKNEIKKTTDEPHHHSSSVLVYRYNNLESLSGARRISDEKMRTIEKTRALEESKVNYNI